MGILSTVKVVLTNNLSNAKVAEAGCWFLYNVSFDIASLKIMIRLQFEELAIKILKLHGAVKNVQEWAEAVIKRIRVAFLASTPTAIAERNMVSRDIKSIRIP
jgi:hypothetical protein